MPSAAIRRALASAAAVTLALSSAAACGSDGPPTATEDRRDVPVTVQVAAASAQIQGVSVEVTGPGITVTAVANLAPANGMFTGRVTVPAGGNRVFTVRAFDARAIETHTGTATADVRPGDGIALTVKLYARGGGVPIQATVSSYTVTLLPGDTTLALGGAPARLRAAVVDADGAPVPNARLEWASTNPVVARVDSTGAVTAGYPGETRVVASFEGLAAAATLRVRRDTGTTTPPPPPPPPPPGPARVARVVVSAPSDTVRVGVTAQLTATLFDSAGRQLADVPVTWTTSDSTVLRYGPLAGVFTGVRAGQATATAAAQGVTGTRALVVIGASAQVAWEMVETSLYHSCGLSRTGWAYCWGDNGAGQLGNDDWSERRRRLTPVPVAGGLTFRAVTTGASHSCALAADGAAYCWGGNTAGQLGVDNSTNDRFAPTAVAGGVLFSSITAGSGATCALTSAGAAYCWGTSFGGEGGAVRQSSPAAVPGGLAFSAIDAGDGHACGLAASGSVYCWGRNDVGQLGDGTTTASAAPVRVAGALQFRQISAGGHRTCGVTTVGETYCWGGKPRGQLATDTAVVQPTPARVAGAPAFAVVAVGASVPLSACALTGSGQAYCWGDNTYGQLGDGTVGGQRAAPAPVGGEQRFMRLATSSTGACGVTAEGVAYCWGYNAAGTIGDGTDDNNRPLPTRVAQP